MDHAEATELIELAALEPDGLERLMAGDTPDSAAVAGHLAGCPECVAGMAQIRRSAAVIRAAIVDLPDPALKGRTLAFVREVGRERSAGTATGPAASATPAGSAAAPHGASVVPVAASASPAPVVMPLAGRAPSPRSRWLGLVGLAAALVLAAGLGFGAARLSSPPGAANREVSILQGTTETMLRLGTQPDTRRVELAATTSGAGSAGTLLFSPSSGELVMVASGLAGLMPGQEYGCWIEANGVRRRIGRMYQGGDLQSWAGPVSGLAGLAPGTVFGVSLVSAGGGTGQPVLTGGL